MRNRVCKIAFPVFNGYEVRVILSGDVPKTCRRLREKAGDCLDMFIPGAEDSRRSYIVFPLDPNEGTIAHEASHAVRELLKASGAKLDEEVFAYHLGFLVERIHKFIKK